MTSLVELSDNDYDEVMVDDSPINDDGVEEPKVGMTFSNEEEVRSYYMKYAKQKGFGVRRRNSRQSDGGKVRWFTLVCARQGICISRASNVLRPRQTERVGCKARVNSVLNEDGGYTLSSVILDHTHVCSPGKSRHFRCFKKVDGRVKKRLEINDEAGIRTSKTFKSVVVEAGGYENVPFGKTLKKPSTRRRLPTTERSSQLSREDRHTYSVSWQQNEVLPQTQGSCLYDQGSEVWTHAPVFFSTPSTAPPPPVESQAQPMRFNLSDQDDLYTPRWWQP